MESLQQPKVIESSVLQSRDVSITAAGATGEPGVQERPRVWFAHSARAIAALLVVWFHLGETFFVRHELVAKVTFFAPQGASLQLPFWSGLSFAAARVGLELGTFGGAIFFLISGFVIVFAWAEVLHRVELPAIDLEKWLTRRSGVRSSGA